MKKIGNRPITEADTDYSKQQIFFKKIKKSKKFPENFREEVCDSFFYFMNLTNEFNVH